MVGRRDGGTGRRKGGGGGGTPDSEQGRARMHGDGGEESGWRRGLKRRHEASRGVWAPDEASSRNQLERKVFRKFDSLRLKPGTCAWGRAAAPSRHLSILELFGWHQILQTFQMRAPSNSFRRIGTRRSQASVLALENTKWPKRNLKLGKIVVSVSF
ncbi:hypothetical protein K439DRAFT_1665918 [Ramaria rubella]|nr:hypothetical protein K439DRAFT_1665918 [Ramaria rubella]